MTPLTAGKPGTALVPGSTTVATAQTAVQVTTAVLKGTLVGVWLCADPGNVGKNVVVGIQGSVNAKPKSVVGIPVNVPVFLEIDDPSKLWVDVETSGDKLAWLAVLA